MRLGGWKGLGLGRRRHVFSRLKILLALISSFLGVWWCSARKLQVSAEEEGSKLAGMVLAMDNVMTALRYSHIHTQNSECCLQAITHTEVWALWFL